MYMLLYTEEYMDYRHSHPPPAVRAEGRAGFFNDMILLHGGRQSVAYHRVARSISSQTTAWHDIWNHYQDILLMTIDMVAISTGLDSISSEASRIHGSTQCVGFHRCSP
jgi:hypothetical protein